MSIQFNHSCLWIRSIIGAWLSWSSWSEWSECIGGNCGRTGNRSKTRKRIQYSRKNELSKTYPHLVNVTRSFYDGDVKTKFTGKLFGGEEIQEKPGKCTIIGYWKCFA